MSRIRLLALLAIIAITASSCVPHTPIPPIGVWASTEPNIVLYLDPNYQITRGIYLGLFVDEDYENKIIMQIGNGPRFTFHKASAIRADGILDGSNPLFSGTWQMVDNQIHFNTPAFQEETDSNVVIFSKVEDYDPINPEDWFPQLFP